MEAALYHPEFGYYRRPRDPFGIHGDFYTAEQLQPVFGIANRGTNPAACRDRMGAPEDFTVVELGAGRGEMAAALARVALCPRGPGRAAAGPRPRRGLFQRVLRCAAGSCGSDAAEAKRESCAWALEGDRFTWIEAGPAPEEVECYRKRYLGALSDGQIFEAALESLAWLERIAAALEDGFVVTVDYGYTAAELLRFPSGTLMSYRRHQALEDVLKDPGEQDITAHVCFSALQGHGAARGPARPTGSSGWRKR